MSTTETQTASHVEHVVTIKGAEVTLPFPKDFDDGQVAESAANIEGMIDDFGGSQAKGKQGATRVLEEVRKLDPTNSRGHKLYYDPYVKRFKEVVRATANVSEPAISRFFSELRETLPTTDPWYLDPNRTESSTSGGPAKGTARATSHAAPVPVRIEDPDRFEVESLVVALTIRLKNLDPSELKNAIGFLTELEDLKDTAIPHGLGVVNGFIRQSGGS